MEITWLGHSCFRLRSREAVVVTDPCSPTTGHSIGKLTADIVTISHDHPGHSYLKAVTGKPVVIVAPGEYEIGGVFIAGIPTYHEEKKDPQRSKNTAYMIEMDNIRLCHLGDLGHVPTQTQVEALSDVDVLLVPVGGLHTIDAPKATEVISLIEPRIVIPMHHRTKGSWMPLAKADKFIKGKPRVKRLNTNRVNIKALPKETTIMELKPRK